MTSVCIVSIMVFLIFIYIFRPVLQKSVGSKLEIATVKQLHRLVTSNNKKKKKKKKTLMLMF